MTHDAQGNLWGWMLPARVILAGLALGFALSLAATTPCAVGRSAIDLSPAVDPNTAPSEVLLALPRLGPAMVRRIVAERRRGPFQSIDDFDSRVRGVGPATIAALRPYFQFEPASRAMPFASR